MQPYGDFTDTEHRKIFRNVDFGDRTIAVERPLRLNFKVTPERLTRLDHVKALAKLDGDALKKALKDTGPERVWNDPEPPHG